MSSHKQHHTFKINHLRWDSYPIPRSYLIRNYLSYTTRHLLCFLCCLFFSLSRLLQYKLMTCASYLFPKHILHDMKYTNQPLIQYTRISEKYSLCCCFFFFFHSLRASFSVWGEHSSEH